MAIRSMLKSKIESLEDLCIDQLKDLCDVEDQIIEKLPKMIEAAKADDLKSALREHLEVTKTQRERLNRVFKIFGQESSSSTCKGIRGILDEGNELEGRLEGDAVTDAGLIAAAQRVEHYEMAAYGCARTFAKTLGRDEAAQLLQQSLDEEGEADKKLTQIAESHRNVEALQSA